MICHQQSVTQQRLDSWWDQFRASGDTSARERLAEHYWPMVERIAAQMRPRLAGQVDIDDLVSAGGMGLFEALNGFNPARGASFKTYCNRRVRGAILDDLRAMDCTSRLARRRSKMLAEATRSFHAGNGRKPGEAELAEALGLTVPQMRRFEQGARVIKLVPLGASRSPWCDEDAETCLPEDRRGCPPDQSAERRELKEFVIRGLTRIERLAVTMYYYEEMSQEEIGRTLGFSAPRVCQLLSAALARTRGRLVRSAALRLSA